ncbi:hypothetical protein H0H92_010048 [Tricholoma furcatifolium]|nr:hypothetical protein H0H92_010048 [Tricholoma furcatifolium]
MSWSRAAGANSSQTVLRPAPELLPTSPEALITPALAVKLKDDDLKRQRVKLEALAKRWLEAAHVPPPTDPSNAPLASQYPEKIDIEYVDSVDGVYIETPTVSVQLQNHSLNVQPPVYPLARPAHGVGASPVTSRASGRPLALLRQQLRHSVHQYVC